MRVRRGGIGEVVVWGWDMMCVSTGMGNGFSCGMRTDK